MKNNHKKLQQDISRNTVKSYLFVLSIILILFFLKIGAEKDLLKAPFAEIQNYLIDLEKINNSVELSIESLMPENQQKIKKTTSIDKSNNIVIEKDTLVLEIIEELPEIELDIIENTDILEAEVGISLLGEGTGTSRKGTGNGDFGLGNKSSNHNPINTPKQELNIVEIPSVDSQINLNELYSNLEYPRRAKINDIEGSVIITVLISPKGQLLRHKIEGDPHPYLIKSAIEAIYKCNFIPAEFEGEKVASWLTIPIKFQLR